jgi:hypothetical protein
MTIGTQQNVPKIRERSTPGCAANHGGAVVFFLSSAGWPVTPSQVVRGAHSAIAAAGASNACFWHRMSSASTMICAL